LMRNTPDAERWIELADEQGVGAAIAERDGGYGDYSQATRDDKPDPTHVVD